MKLEKDVAQKACSESSGTIAPQKLLERLAVRIGVGVVVASR